MYTNNCGGPSSGRLVNYLYTQASFKYPLSRLFFGILAQAIHDVSREDKVEEASTEDAQSWFLTTDTTFETICDILELDAIRIRKEIIDAIHSRRRPQNGHNGNRGRKALEP